MGVSHGGLIVGRAADGSYLLALSEPAADKLDAAFSGLDEGVETVRLSLTGVDLLDAEVVRVLGRAAAELRGRGGRLLLVGSDPRLVSALSLIGVEQDPDFHQRVLEGA